MTIWQVLGSFPTAVPTVLLAIVMFYWLLSIVGVIDIGDSMEIDASAHDGHELHSIGGYLVALGLGGVPFSIAVTFLVFFTWLFTAILHQYVVAYVPTAPLQWLMGAGSLLLSAAVSIPISARLIRPMRGLFVKHLARSNKSLVGLRCRIVTQNVDEKFGRAEVDDNGASLNIRVWAKSPNALTKNSTAIILAYDDATRQYEVQSADVTVEAA